MMTRLTPNIVLGSRDPAVFPKFSPSMVRTDPGSTSAGVICVILTCRTENSPIEFFVAPPITTTGPVLAFKGTFTMIKSFSQSWIKAGTPLNSTRFLPVETNSPKSLPPIVTVVPGGPEAGKSSA